jgi:CheY-like chemotaxis protein
MDLPANSPLKSSVLAIKKSGEKAADIVQDMLTLARRGVAVSKVVNLNDIITDYIESPEFETLKHTHPGLKLEVSLEPALLGITGSPVHLSKTVMNLISNAAEALVDGGTVSISSENRYIDKPISGYDDIEEGDYVTLTVSDTGTGIPATDIERIFEPFYTKKAMGRSGTGLGMAVIWGTVKDHRGYIDVQSTEGQGTWFYLYLPASRQRSSSKAFQRSIKDYRGKGEFLLIIDDVKDQRNIATEILTKLGYKVESVSSGEEAVEYLETRSADLLILDMIMDPGIDGLETYRQIIKVHPAQKAIIASGYSESARVKEAQKLGVGAYVKKPYLMEKMAVAVRKELDR